MSDLPPIERRIKHPIASAVHGVLWREWDPIGLTDFGPVDEYDGYIWPIIGRIMRGETPEQIAVYLDWASGDCMGSPQPPGRNLDIARRLAGLKPPA